MIPVAAVSFQAVAEPVFSGRPGATCSHETAVAQTLDIAAPAEGVLYAEKDFNLPKHPQVDVSNLVVIKLMQSFKSRELVTERFAWRHYYW